MRTQIECAKHEVEAAINEIFDLNKENERLDSLLQLKRKDLHSKNSFLNGTKSPIKGKQHFSVLLLLISISIRVVKLLKTLFLGFIDIAKAELPFKVPISSNVISSLDNEIYDKSR